MKTVARLKRPLIGKLNALAVFGAWLCLLLLVVLFVYLKVALRAHPQRLLACALTRQLPCADWPACRAFVSRSLSTLQWPPDVSGIRYAQSR